MASDALADAKGDAQRTRVILILLLLVAFALRAFRLDAQSLWYDEGVTAWLAQLPLAQQATWTANDIQPPLYYAIVSAWGHIAGWSEWSLRFLSLFFGVLCVPLLFVVARGWSADRPRVALFAAALTATHPLLIYYAQEARMYALLLALSLAATVVLLPSYFGAMAWRRWLGYGLLGALALYTHYFALFLLAALAVAWLWQFGSHRQGLGRFAAAHGLIALLYAPWALVVVRRFGVDASYWQGSLKMDEALRSVAARFIGGETLAEGSAVVWAALILGLTLVGWIALVVWAPERRSALRFAALGLVIPVASALLLAALAPKFNPRYVLLGLSGLILIWAFLLDALAARPGFGARMATLGAAALLLTPFTWATANWYFNPNFAKAQWRELAEFLRPRIDPTEGVILVSGHAWPVWAYYAPDMPLVRLPAIDVLDVNQVLDFAATAAPLRVQAALQPGAWLIGWQDEVVDPNGVVAAQLELAGREKGSSARFHQLSLRRFSRLAPERIAAAPPISVPVGVSFGEGVRLEGYHLLDNGDLLLFWSLLPGAPPGADYQMTLDVTGANGEPIAHPPDRRLAGYNDPTFRWQPGEVVMGRVPAVDWLGPEPQLGNYTLRIGVYDAADPALARLPVARGDTLTLADVAPVLE
jgi:4-amino-4-deoxy-L-arabinose transferase-like glycosyltransferase